MDRPKQVCGIIFQRAERSIGYSYCIGRHSLRLPCVRRFLSLVGAIGDVPQEALMTIIDAYRCHLG